MADKHPVVYSRSVYHRNAKAKSGLMTNPKDYGKQRKERINNRKIASQRTTKTLSDGLQSLKMVDTEKPSPPPLSNETRFTIPNSPNNVNIVVAHAKRAQDVHSQVMKKLNKADKKATEEAEEV